MRERKREKWLAALALAGALAAFPAWGLAADGGSRFSLRLHGGYSYLMADDVNTGLGGWYEYFRLLGAEAGMTAEDGYDPIHGGYDVGADLFFHLSPRIAIGLGAGYLRNSRASDMTLSGEGMTVTIDGRGTLSAVPIRLSVLTTWPLGGKMSLIAGAGAAYYAAVKLDGFLRAELSSLEDNEWIEQSIRAEMSRLSNIGFHAGLGLEYEMSRRMFLFVEAQGRLAKFKNFDEAVGRTEGSSITPFEDRGKIYLRTTSLPPVTLFIVSAATPIPEPGVSHREPKFDFSGFCLQAGVRFRF